MSRFHTCSSVEWRLRDPLSAARPARSGWSQHSLRFSVSLRSLMSWRNDGHKRGAFAFGMWTYSDEGRYEGFPLLKTSHWISLYEAVTQPIAFFVYSAWGPHFSPQVPRKDDTRRTLPKVDRKASSERALTSEICILSSQRNGDWIRYLQPGLIVSAI